MKLTTACWKDACFRGPAIWNLLRCHERRSGLYLIIHAGALLERNYINNALKYRLQKSTDITITSLASRTSAIWLALNTSLWNTRHMHELVETKSIWYNKYFPKFCCFCYIRASHFPQPQIINNAQTREYKIFTSMATNKRRLRFKAVRHGPINSEQEECGGAKSRGESKQTLWETLMKLLHSQSIALKWILEWMMILRM